MPPPVTPPITPPVSVVPSGPAWTDPLLVDPHGVGDKARRVNEMFSAIAPSYDLNNRLHSMGVDQHWRNVAVKMAGVRATDQIVDVACGTGDLTLKFAQAAGRYHRRPGVVMGLDGPRRQQPPVVGIDFTYEMLPIARKKADHTPARGRQVFDGEAIDRMIGNGAFFIQGDALQLPLADASVDIVSIAFGIRNVQDWGAAIEEFARVLRPGGRLIVLEFSLPTNRVMRGLYNFYFRKIMPRTATWISGDRSGAYKYLPESVNTFISRELMQERMRGAGFGEVVARAMTFGVCVCYKGVRK